MKEATNDDGATTECSETIFPNATQSASLSASLFASIAARVFRNDTSKHDPAHEPE